MERKMKATKGQTVYILGTWNDFNVMSIRKVCVHSWGKKLAKFVDMTTGQMIQQQYRLQNGDEPDIFPTLEDAQAEAASILENEIEMALASLAKRINYKLEKSNPPSKDDTEKLADYKLNGCYSKDYNQLCQEIRNRN
jgi:hypothetical protein